MTTAVYRCQEKVAGNNMDNSKYEAMITCAGKFVP